MSTQAFEDLAQQVDRLDTEGKLELLAHLVDSLRRQIRTDHRPLVTYYGLGAGQGFSSADEVDAFLKEERAQWER
jgi:hypothetical protein